MSGYKRVNYYELCRLCTSSEGSKIHIFCEDGKRRQLQNKIQICLPLHVCEDDSLPKIVCLGCLEKLESFYDFRESCVTSKSMLESYFTSMRFSDDLLKEGKVYIKEPTDKRKPKTEQNPIQSPPVQNTKPNIETVNTFQPIQIISTERPQQNNENQSNVPQLMLSWANPQSTDVLQLQIKDGSLQERIKIFENLPALLAQNVCLKCKQVFVNQEDITNHLCVSGETNYIIPDAEIPDKLNKPTLTSVQTFEQPQKSPKMKKEQQSTSNNASTSLRTSAALAANRTLTQNAISSLLTSNNVCPNTNSSENVQQNIPNSQAISINLNNSNMNQQNYNLNFNQTNLTNSLIENHFNQSLATFNTSQPQDNMNLINQNNIITTSSGQFNTVGNMNQANLNNLNMLSQNTNINQSSNLITGPNCTQNNTTNVQTSTHNNLSLGQTYVLNQSNQTHIPTSQVSNITETVLSQLNVSQNNFTQNSSQSNMNKSDDNGNSSNEPSNQSKVNQQQNQPNIDNSNQNQPVNNQSTPSQTTGAPGSFTCETCNKCFKRKEHLLQHRKLHSGERPFTCLSCLKSFSRKEHLLRHSISHTGTKNFQCDLCQKSFSRKDNLHKHRKTHEVSGPYICDVCNKSFVIKHYYLIHKMSHQSDDKDTVAKTSKKNQKAIIKNESTINMSDLKSEPETYMTNTVNNTSVNSSIAIKNEEPLYITSIANTSVPFSAVKTTVHNSLVQTVTRNTNTNSDLTNHIGNVRTSTIDQTSSEQNKNNIHYTGQQSQQNDKQSISNITQNSLIPNSQNFQQITQQNAVVSLGQTINNNSSNNGNINNMQNTIIQNFVPISSTNFTELAYAAHNTRNIVQHVSVANNIQLIDHNKHLAQILTNPKYREKYAGGLKIESVICKEPMLNQGIIVVPKNEQIIMSERTDVINKIDSSNKLKKLKTNHNTKLLSNVNDLNNKATNVLFSGTIKTNGGNNVSPLLTSNIMTSIQQNNIFNSNNVSTQNTIPTISTSNSGQFICSSSSANELQQFDYNKRINS